MGDDSGQTTTYTNSRSCLVGKEGDGLNSAWRQGFHKGSTSGPTHAGTGSDSRNRVFFARIYGTLPSIGLQPQLDYVHMQHSTDSSTHKFKMNVWKNTGAGGAKLKADGDKYCDMTGNNRDDYV